MDVSGPSYSATIEMVAKAHDYYKFLGAMAVRLVQETSVEPRVKLPSEHGTTVDLYV